MRTHQSRKHTLHTPGRKRSHRRSNGDQVGVLHPHPALPNSLIQRMVPCPCDGGCPRCATHVQADLKIGQPGDQYEQEADRAAEQVMRMSEPFVQRQPIEEEEEELMAKPLDGQITPLVQRQPIEEEEEELMAKPLDGQLHPLIQTQCCDEEEVAIQTQSSGRQNSQQSIGSRVQFHAGNCPGKPLHGSTLNFFEPRFGRDFRDVRVHTCDSAVQMSNELSAQAFTYGNNIFFNSGKYNPESFEGKRLLGHELTHTVQQNNGVIQRKSATIVCDGKGGYMPDLGAYSKAVCGLDECVFYHETVHCDDWRERWPNGCKTKKGKPRPKGAKVPAGTSDDAEYMAFYHGSECSAFDVTRRCIEHIIPHAEGDCKKKLEAELKTAIASRDYHCKRQ